MEKLLEQTAVPLGADTAVMLRTLLNSDWPPMAAALLEA